MYLTHDKYTFLWSTTMKIGNQVLNFHGCVRMPERQLIDRIIEDVSFFSKIQLNSRYYQEEANAGRFRFPSRYNRLNRKLTVFWSCKSSVVGLSYIESNY